MKFNKIFSNLACGMAALALCAGFTACSDDDNDGPVWGEDPKLVSSSVADGAVVDPSVKSVSLVYNREIVINSNGPILVNGNAVNATYGDDNYTVKVPVSLAFGNTYTIEVPANGIAVRAEARFAPAVKISFITGAAPVSPVLDLSNTNATEQARKVYDYLVQQNGKKILSGAMANVNNNNLFADWINSVTGKYPAITGYDFIHLQESGQNWIDYSDITPAKTQWDNNGLVTYMWHWRVPTDKAAYDAKDYDKYGYNVPGKDVENPTEFDIREALKEGTWQNEVLLADIDKVSGYLKQLQDAGIAVLWRPLHEAAGSYKYNGAWFWWGRYGDQYTKQLWQLMYDRMVKTHGLNNLIWVWTAQYEAGFEGQMGASYPGNEYVDIVGTDIYADDDASQVAAYSAINSMVGGQRLVTISETGLVQNPDKCLTDGAKWSYFMIWYTYDQHQSGNTTDGFGNTAESLRAVFNSANVINRSDLPSFK